MTLPNHHLIHKDFTDKIKFAKKCPQIPPDNLILLSDGILLIKTNSRVELKDAILRYLSDGTESILLDPPSTQTITTIILIWTNLSGDTKIQDLVLPVINIPLSVKSMFLAGFTMGLVFAPHLSETMLEEMYMYDCSWLRFESYGRDLKFPLTLRRLYMKNSVVYPRPCWSKYKDFSYLVNLECIDVDRYYITSRYGAAFLPQSTIYHAIDNKIINWWSLSNLIYTDSLFYALCVDTQKLPPTFGIMLRTILKGFRGDRVERHVFGDYYTGDTK